jgi:sugar (pentulose or hexulose) kinase
MTLFIGIDIGTSACRACAINAQADIVATARNPLPSPTRNDAAIEQEPSVWWQTLQDTLDSLCTDINSQEVKRIAIDGTSSTLLLCTPDGKALGPALMYNDTRATQQSVRVAAIAPDNSPARGVSSSLAKLLWLQAHYPAEEFRALHQADWLTGKLLGRFDQSDENNCLKLGYDAALRRWPDWLEQLALPTACFPNVIPAGTPLGPLLPKFQTRWNFSPDTQLVAGTTDSTAGFIATGATTTGTAVTALGSTLVLKILTEQPIFAAEYGIYSHRLGDRWLVGGASNSGGAVLKQFFNDQELNTLSAQIDPQKSAPYEYRPLPGNGERFPVNDPSLQPLLTPRPESDADFLHGLLESIARIEQRGYRLLAELGAPYPDQVISVGGGACNATWSAIRELLLGIPVITAENQEAAYGAALLARNNL